jgi:hypothetical protein
MSSQWFDDRDIHQLFGRWAQAPLVELGLDTESFFYDNVLDRSLPLGRWRGLSLSLSANEKSRARRVSLGGMWLGPATLPVWPFLEEFNVGERVPRSLAPLPAEAWPASLRSLSLSLSRLDETREQDALSTLLASLPGPVLRLRLHQVSDNGPRPWASNVRPLDRLAALTIRDARSLGGLADGANLSGLRELRLSLGPQVPAAALARLLGSPTLRRLRVLALEGPQLGEELVVRAVVDSPHLDRLNDLELRGRFGGDVVRRLAGWPGLSRLVRLGLHPPAPRAPGEEAMTELARSPHLSRQTQLGLSGISLTPSLCHLFRDRLGWRARF